VLGIHLHVLRFIMRGKTIRNMMKHSEGSLWQVPTLLLDENVNILT